CYGQGTSTKSLHGQVVDPMNEPDVVYCYDPADHNKGTHAWPYVHYVWAYDANDLKDSGLDVGQTLPWNVKPYAVWQMSLPFDGAYGVSVDNGDATTDMENRRLGGAAYDPATGRIFVSQGFDDGRTPLIHVYSLSSTPAPPPTPCSLGTYSATGNEPCTPAPAGYYVGATGATSPALCGLGTYSNVTGASACTPAPAGYYV